MHPGLPPSFAGIYGRSGFLRHRFAAAGLVRCCSLHGRFVRTPDLLRTLEVLWGTRSLHALARRCRVATAEVAREDSIGLQLFSACGVLGLNGHTSANTTD